jgi:ribosomal-protein-alanine N-acetyltransferase
MAGTTAYRGVVSPTPIHTERLVMRRWRPDDRDPFAALNADPAVMEYFPSAHTREESDALVEKNEAGFETWGFGLWALEVRSTGTFIGFTGLSVPSFEAAFTPAVEVGWRLARDAWGHGYATEAARSAIAEGFEEYRLSEIVSFTFEGNARSRAVMERLGMSDDPNDDFDHPALGDHWLARHVLYRMPAERWCSTA